MYPTSPSENLVLNVSDDITCTFDVVLDPHLVSYILWYEPGYHRVYLFFFMIVEKDRDAACLTGYTIKAIH